MRQCIVLVMLTLCVILPARADSGPLIAAASSLRTLWPALMQSYESNASGPSPRVSFGSSGLLSTQILNGAPFDIFLSADLASIERFPPHILIDAPKIFARGELSLVVPASSSLVDSLSLETLTAYILEHSEKAGLRIAIPNPVHAPYGRAAREALVSAGIWPLPANRLLTAENAAQTLQFIKTGAVAAAIVPRSLVFTQNDGIAKVDLPSDRYQPVEHVMVLPGKATGPARAFANWLLGDQARKILEDSGLRVDRL